MEDHVQLGEPCTVQHINFILVHIVSWLLLDIPLGEINSDVKLSHLKKTIRELELQGKVPGENETTSGQELLNYTGMDKTSLDTSSRTLFVR